MAIYVQTKKSLLLLVSPPPAGQTHFQSIDIARGLAALCVAVYHYRHFFLSTYNENEISQHAYYLPMYHALEPVYEHGAAAVQLFWTISGFVFLAVYAGTISTTKQFIINRVARLYPLHATMLVIVAVLQFTYVKEFGRSFVYQENTPLMFIAQIFLASNWFTDNSSFNGPIWSVSLEIIIYAVFWVLLPIVSRVGIIGFGLVAALFLLWSEFNNLGTLLPQCGYYFFAGCSVYMIYSSFRAIPVVPALLAVAVIAATWLITTEIRPLREPMLLAAICPALVLLLSVADTTADRLHITRAGWLGAVTYGIYLCHFPVQIIFTLCVALGGTALSIFSQPWMLALYVVSVVTAGVLSYHFIEKPGRDIIRNWRRKHRGLITGKGR